MGDYYELTDDPERVLERLTHDYSIFPTTPDELFKAYLEREMPQLPKNVSITVDVPTYLELQHIKDNITKTYTLGFPLESFSDGTTGITDEMQKIASIENRHIDIVSNIIDMFKKDSLGALSLRDIVSYK